MTQPSPSVKFAKRSFTLPQSCCVVETWSRVQSVWPNTCWGEQRAWKWASEYQLWDYLIRTKYHLRIFFFRVFCVCFFCLFVLFNTLSWTLKWLAWYELRQLVSLWCGLSVSVLMLLLAVPFSVSSVSVFASCFSVWLCYACFTVVKLIVSP